MQMLLNTKILKTTLFKIHPISMIFLFQQYEYHADSKNNSTTQHREHTCIKEDL